MTNVVRIVERVVDPPPPRTAEVSAAVRAVDACGHWPITATVDEYRASVALAATELGRTAEIWRRYCRRFNQWNSPIERAPSRLRARYYVAAQLFDQRVETVRQLIDGPTAGCA